MGMNQQASPAFDLREAIQLLRRTPETLRALLADLDDPWLAAHEGPGTWTCTQVVAHLADLEETDWMVRTRVILAGDENAVFTPIDRERFQTSLAGMPMRDLLDVLSDRRRQNVDALEALCLTREDLSRRARHPDFGPVTLGQLLATWTVHDLTHIAQIARVMARRYDRDVGPWRAFLSVLSRERLPAP